MEPGPDRTVGRWWKLALVAVALGWLLLTVILLIRSSTPSLGLGGPTEHVIVGAVLAFVLAGVLSIPGRWSPAVLAWVTTIATTALVVVLELMQLLVPIRSFQFEDLVYSISGIVIGSGLGALLSMAGSARAVIRLVVAVGGIGLLVAVTTAVVRDPAVLDARTRSRLTDCARLVNEDLRATDGYWEELIIDAFVASPDDADCLMGGPEPFTGFAGSVEPDRPAGSTSFDGGGLVSTPLTGLAAEVGANDELTLGVRFRLRDRAVEAQPSIMVRLAIDADSDRSLAQLFHRGPHLGASMGSGRRFVGAGLGLADAVPDGGAHELIMTYQAGTTVAYLDGEVFTTNRTEPFDLEVDSELTLAVGRRLDQAWHPFDGDIEGLLISSRALDRSQIDGAFDR
ncbi:MAG: LamG-like jellyroll fold domain-containing protein [Acidimicrobiales bacterium]